MKPDLESIYSELDLSPNCSLEEFQRAYRKQISELHPDRNGGPQPADTQAALRDLIWVYAAVNRFHRRYGRMPGGHASKSHATTLVRSRDLELIAYDSDGSRHNRSKQSTFTVIVLFIVLLILLALEMAESG